jgi:cytochrome c-type biogenesis protein CcmH
VDELAVRPASRPLAGNRLLATSIAIIVPTIAIGLYARLGDVRSLAKTEVAASAGAVVKRAPDAKEPIDAAGWQRVARAYTEQQRHAEAADAYAHAAALAPGDAYLLAEQAEAIAMANGRDLSGEPMRILQAALALEPRHPRALALAGVAAYTEGDYATAIAYWERLRALLPAGSENARKIEGRLAEARAVMEGQAKSAAGARSR